MKLNLAFVGEEHIPDFSGLVESEEEILAKLESMPHHLLHRKRKCGYNK